MNSEALFLFLILLLGLVLCSFLGGKCGNEGFTNNNVVYNGPNGATATMSTDSNGTNIITLIQPASTKSNVIFTQSSSNNNLYTNPSGFSATFSNGNILISGGGPVQTFTPSTSPTTPSTSPTTPSTSPTTPSTSSTTPSTSSTTPSSSSNSSYDNYNHYSGSSSQLLPGTTFNGPNGGTVVVNPTSDGSQSLQITLTSGQQPITFNTSASSSTTQNYNNYSGNNQTSATYYGPNGEVATVINNSDGMQVITVQTSSGSYTYTQSGTTSNQNSTTSTQYYGSTGYPIQSSSSSLSYQGPYGGSTGSVTGPAGNSAYYAQGPYGNSAVGTSSSSSSNNYNYSSSLPSGIPASQIPAGQENLYILKSQIVPPVCPACPTSAACPRQEKCPPCPACARCPEPSFECKKVPNYNAIDNSYLPAPVLSDFSSFGM
jgi:hypothetical protein